jgi:crotonobetainyl-CoA:carnitine CoA-transferase CaiB-like acyl-CoA transferase
MGGWAGTVREPRPAPRFSATPATMSMPAPTFGQHSDDIVTELGFNAVTPRAAGVIS